MILKHEKKDPQLVDGRWGAVHIIQSSRRTPMV